MTYALKTKFRLADHRPFHEREKRYRKATDGMACSYWQVIWLLQGMPAQHVAEITRYSDTWIWYEWMYLYGFVHSQSGRTEWLIVPTIDSETMNLALAQFAHAVSASPQKPIALVMD